MALYEILEHGYICPAVYFIVMHPPEAIYWVLFKEYTAIAIQIWQVLYHNRGALYSRKQ